MKRTFWHRTWQDSLEDSLPLFTQSLHADAFEWLLLCCTFDWLTAGQANIHVSQPEHLILIKVNCCVHHVWGIPVNSCHDFRVRGVAWVLGCSAPGAGAHSVVLYYILMLAVFAGEPNNTCFVSFPAVCEHSQWASETLCLWDAIPARADRVCAGGHPHGDSLLSLQSARCPGLLPSGTRHYWFSSVWCLFHIPTLMLQEELHRYQNVSLCFKGSSAGPIFSNASWDFKKIFIFTCSNPKPKKKKRPKVLL